MKKFKYISTALLAAVVLGGTSCKKYLDINTDPNNILGTPANAPIPQVLTSAVVNIGFTGGSDLSRYTALIMQHFSGQSTGSLNQTQQYEQYLIQPSDLNNLWSSMYATTVNDLETVISKAKSTGSPHYAGVAEVLRVYTYQTIVDTWGKVPYSQANQTTNNLNPAYDDDATIYADLLKQIDQAIVDLNATNPSTASLDPGTNSPIYQAVYSTSKTNWIKFANTLKLRLYLHMLKKDATVLTTINSFIAATPATSFMASNADSFSMPFLASAGSQNPIYQFEAQRANYLVANDFIVSLMNGKSDPRRSGYFTAVGGVYKGAKGGDAPNASSYSHIGTYLTGPNKGDAPVRMLTFAEYNFIRAEIALKNGDTGTAQTFYTAGITASLTDVGVATAAQTTYLAASGILTGTTADMLRQIITEKYVASYGQVTEPWSDYRRTGYPAISVPVNAVISYVPRSLYYPQSEIDANTSAKQKADMSTRVFWDVQ